MSTRDSPSSTTLVELARLLGRLAAREWLSADGAPAGGEGAQTSGGASARAPDTKRGRP